MTYRWKKSETREKTEITRVFSASTVIRAIEDVSYSNVPSHLKILEADLMELLCFSSQRASLWLWKSVNRGPWQPAVGCQWASAVSTPLAPVRPPLSSFQPIQRVESAAVLSVREAILMDLRLIPNILSDMLVIRSSCKPSVVGEWCENTDAAKCCFVI